MLSDGTFVIYHISRSVRFEYPVGILLGYIPTKATA